MGTAIQKNLPDLNDSKKKQAWLQEYWSKVTARHWLPEKFDAPEQPSAEELRLTM